MLCKQKKKEREGEKLRGTDTQGLISDLLFYLFLPRICQLGQDSSAGGMANWKSRCNADVSWIPQCLKRFLFLESAFSVDSLKVFRQPMCAIVCINICMHVHNLFFFLNTHWQPYPIICVQVRKRRVWCRWVWRWWWTARSMTWRRTTSSWTPSSRSLKSSRSVILHKVL